jgi:phage terminase small subunit
MHDCKVNTHIQAALAERNKRTGINADITIRELARIALANPVRVLLQDGSIDVTASEDDLAAIQAVKVKCIGYDKETEEPLYEREVRFYDKNKSLELLMKHQGMLIERKQVDVTTKANEMPDDVLDSKIKAYLDKATIDITPRE